MLLWPLKNLKIQISWPLSNLCCHCKFKKRLKMRTNKNQSKFYKQIKLILKENEENFDNERSQNNHGHSRIHGYGQDYRRRVI